MNKVFNRGDEVIRAEALGKTYAEGACRPRCSMGWT